MRRTQGVVLGLTAHQSTDHKLVVASFEGRQAEGEGRQAEGCHSRATLLITSTYCSAA